MEIKQCCYAKVPAAQVIRDGEKPFNIPQETVADLQCFGQENCLLGMQPGGVGCLPTAGEEWGNLRCVECGFETPLGDWPTNGAPYPHRAYLPPAGPEGLCGGKMEFVEWPKQMR